MDVVLVFPSPFSPREALAQAIKRVAGEKLKVSFEGECIVCEKASDPVELMLKLSRVYGISKVAIAKKVSSQFSDVSSAIVKVGRKVILPDKKFYVKAIIQETAKASYVDRDVEFASSGALTSTLAGINARPAKHEDEADKVVTAVVGKDSAYVCMEVREGVGGIPFGLLGRILCSLHSYQSFLSCIHAAIRGFEPQIVLLYAGENELLEGAKLVRHLAEQTGLQEHKLIIAPISVPDAPASVASLVRDRIALRILLRLSNGRMALPLSLATHPRWFIESAMREVVLAGKSPYMPLMFLFDNFRDGTPESLKARPKRAATKVTKGEFQKYSRAIDSAARSSLKRIKTLRLEVGPNYLDDILDSA